MSNIKNLVHQANTLTKHSDTVVRANLHCGPSFAIQF